MTKSKYTPSDKLRKHIALWEAADFAGQNERFGGDAIGAKHSEFMNMLGDTASKLTSNELDGLLSTYYNLSPKTFKEKLLPSVQAYANDPSAVNRQVLKDTLLNRYTLSAKKYQRGIKRRAAADVALMGFPEDEISISDLPDGGRMMRIRPQHAQKPQMDTTSIQKPLVLQPVQRVAPVREVPIQEEPHTITKVLPLTNVVGSAPEPSFGLPSLDQMLDLGSPEKQMQNHVAQILGIPDIHPKLPMFRKGRVGEDEPIDGGTPFSITVTGKDRRPAWKRMYENPNLGDTSQYYNGDAIRSITEWMPGIGDVQQGFDAYDAAKNGNYTEAAMLGGLLLLPNAMEGPLKAGGKVVKKAIDYRMPSGDDVVNKMRKYYAERELEGTLDGIQISTGDIAKDPYINRMGIAEGKKYTKYPSVVVENLENSIYSRMKAMRPWLKPEEFAKQFFSLADGKWTSHPVETFKYAYGDGSNVIGQFSPNTGNIAVRAGSDVEAVLLHEIRHKLDDGIPLTEEEENILRAAYGDKFLEIPKVDPTWEQSGLGRDYNIWDEAVTTNRDARDKALGKVKAREWPVGLQNKIIDKLSDQQILEAVAGANGYGRSFVDNLIGDGPLDARLVPKEQIKAWREAMKKVGMFSGAAWLGARTLYPKQNNKK